MSRPLVTLFDTSQFNVKTEGITIDSGGGPLVLRGHTLVKEFVTSENTDKVSGNSTTEVGGKLQDLVHIMLGQGVRVSLLGLST